jgi:hypothetical protein
MIHLFNKTYLDIDKFIDDSQDRIVISAQNGFRLLGRPEPEQYGWLHAYGTTFDEVVGEGKTFSSLYDMLAFCLTKNDTDNRRVIIYCDKATYMLLCALWFKTIFQSITASQAYKIIKADFSKAIVLGSKLQAKVQAEYLATMPTTEEFDTVFAANTPDGDATSFLSSISNLKSLEFLLASYFYNDSCKVQLKSVYRLMINRNVESMLRDTWSCIRANALQSDFQSAIGIQSYTIDNVISLLEDPAVSVLTNVLPHTLPTTEKISSTIDLTVLSTEDKATLKQLVASVHTFTNDTSNVFSRANQYFDIVSKTEFTDADLETVIALELSNEDGVRFWSLKDRENINLYFLDFVFESKKSNQVAVLSPYLLK